ncbi:MAG: ATP-binding protein, partial [Rhodobacterales bacterium]|nr:ATP-binding protein [Rhodobacterales bacterium]
MLDPGRICPPGLLRRLAFLRNAEEFFPFFHLIDFYYEFICLPGAQTGSSSNSQGYPARFVRLASLVCECLRSDSPLAVTDGVHSCGITTSFKFARSRVGYGWPFQKPRNSIGTLAVSHTPLSATKKTWPISLSFTTAAALVNELMEAREERRLPRLQKQLAGVKLLIIDELGFVPLSKIDAELLFEVISQRYERGSTMITSNLPFDEWTETFGTARLTGALLDRLIHHVNILEMNGDSYRLGQSRARK